MKLPNWKYFSIILFFISGCQSSQDAPNADDQKLYPSDVLTHLDKWNLILSDGSNAGQAVNYTNTDYFFTAEQEGEQWVAFKTPNAGNTHGTSNNTRTELAQLKKWTPDVGGKLKAKLKVMNVSGSGDARVPATFSVVVGQIHSADGHENEPLKIFYKKFPGHQKGSVFWNYEINTAGDDNSGRWDYSYPVWGYDFSVVGDDYDDYPPEPKDGIELGEVFTYAVEVKEGIMHVRFESEGHKTVEFTKNLVASEYTTSASIPQQVKALFVPIGQDGVERQTAYADEGLFFKLGSYNQTNGKDPAVNRVWCSGAETHGGDLKKQYADGNFAEVWFSASTLEVSDMAISNEGYFQANDDLQKKVVVPHEVIPVMDKFKILLGDGTTMDDLTNFHHKDFFYTVIDGNRRWVAYKTPNSGITSKNSSNTRSELHEKREWTPEEGGKLTGTCKVMHVSTTGDARVPASFSTVVGQIHSGEGHENEPLKIFYKKFPGHNKGSVFWNYEINPLGDNNGRWDYSTAVWGYDFAKTGSESNVYPSEPSDGIQLGEEFSYEVNVFEGIMYLTFSCDGHPTKTFTKNLLSSEYSEPEAMPRQVQLLFGSHGQDGVERPQAYAGELIYFKQGAYNQSNGKDPKINMLWCAGADIYGGDIKQQYKNGSYTEVWFRETTVGPGTPPNSNLIE